MARGNDGDPEGQIVNTNDLWDTRRVTEFLGLSSPDAFSVYAARYPDWPKPVVGSGRCRFYLRQDFEAFLARHPRLGRKARDGEPGPS